MRDRQPRAAQAHHSEQADERIDATLRDQRKEGVPEALAVVFRLVNLCRRTSEGRSVEMRGSIQKARDTRARKSAHTRPWPAAAARAHVFLQHRKVREGEEDAAAGDGELHRAREGNHGGDDTGGRGGWPMAIGFHLLPTTQLLVAPAPRGCWCGMRPSSRCRFKRAEMLGAVQLVVMDDNAFLLTWC